MIGLIEKLSQNELRIFKAIYEKGPVSRVRLARGLNLGRAAVTLHIKRLMKLGLVLEVGKGITTERRGRREILLTTNPDAGIILAIHISLTQIHYGLINLNGRILISDKRSFPEQADPEHILTMVTDNLQTMIKKYHKDSNRIFGIGVALPGVIDYKTGIVKEKTRNGWEGYNLKHFFEQKFHLQTLIENDVKAVTLGEFYLGSGRHINDMVCLWIRNGIGVGIINEGRLLRGYNSSAGEIGFNEFILDIPTSKSILLKERPRCWGDALSFTNIQKTIVRGIDEGWKTVLFRESNVEDLIAALKKDDPLARYIYNQIVKLLGPICCNMAFTFNPKLMVLNGPLFEHIPKIVDDVRYHLDQAMLRTPLDTLTLKASLLGEEGILIGCAALHLEYIFKTSEDAVLI